MYPILYRKFEGNLLLFVSVCLFVVCRRDSFITHRAFCDALAQESARAISAVNPLLSSHSHGLQLQPPSVKKEQEIFNNLRPDIPPWLSCPPPATESGHGNSLRSTLDFSSPLLPTHSFEPSLIHHDQNPNPTATLLPSNFQLSTGSASPHMSATALLQKASQIGATVSNKTSSSPPTMLMRPHHQQLLQAADHVTAECTSTVGYSCPSSSMASSSSVSGLVMPSREEIATGFVYGNKAAGISSDNYLEEGAANTGASFFHDMMGSSVPCAGGTFERSFSFEEALRGMLNPSTRSDANFQELVSKSTTDQNQFSKSSKKGNDEMTRDFLGLKAFSQKDFFNISGFDHLGSSSYGKQHNQNQSPWQG